ncbi:MAG: phosphatase PAP2 family protein [Pelagibacterales bacterium]|nr:phosphatase PAP2 family protein [Pelagibacterales bacterium]
MRNNKFYLLLLANILLLSSLLWVNFSNIDIEIQNYFFDLQTNSWIVDKEEPLGKLIFYKLPKVLFGLAILGTLIFAILGFKKKNAFLFSNRHNLLLIFLGFCLIPLIAGNIKKFTNIYCPCQLTLYGGDKPYVKIFDHYPAEFQQNKVGQCFPAGHAVTGFALFILFFAFKGRNQKIIAFLSAFFFGWILGLYQMMKGAHFFGDTLIAMLICFLLAAIIAKIYSKFTRYESENY